MNLSKDEKLAILRAADELIGAGGRSLLAKILKGSREKKVLELELDKTPVYCMKEILKLQLLYKPFQHFWKKFNRKSA